MQKRILIFPVLFFNVFAIAQFPGFSLSTDVGVQRSFAKHQRFWSVGHTTIANIHLTERDGVYISFGYFSNGKFSNQLTAAAKSIITAPQAINYKNEARLRLRHFAIGWKRYLKGSPSSEAEQSWNLYAFGGFGLMPGSVTNKHSAIIDTSLYNVPVLSGEGKFKRLTLDLGAGWEKLLGGDIFIYAEARTRIPASDYPSKYLFVNSRAPFTAVLAAGLRLWF